MVSLRSSSNHSDRQRQPTSLAICRAQLESEPPSISTALILKVCVDLCSNAQIGRSVLEIWGADGRRQERFTEILPRILLRVTPEVIDVNMNTATLLPDLPSLSNVVTYFRLSASTVSCVRGSQRVEPSPAPTCPQLGQVHVSPHSRGSYSAGQSHRQTVAV